MNCNKITGRKITSREWPCYPYSVYSVNLMKVLDVLIKILRTHIQFRFSMCCEIEYSGVSEFEWQKTKEDSSQKYEKQIFLKRLSQKIFVLEKQSVIIKTAYFLNNVYKTLGSILMKFWQCI